MAERGQKNNGPLYFVEAYLAERSSSMPTAHTSSPVETDLQMPTSASAKTLVPIDSRSSQRARTQEINLYLH